MRTTLVRRYFEGRTAADIAAQDGVPASTVRARLARGLELLRERLDRESGSRGAWMALIAPLVPRELLPAGTVAGSGAVTASTATVGALTMTLTKLALVASAAVVGGLAWWNLAPAGRETAPEALTPRTTVEVAEARDSTPESEPAQAAPAARSAAAAPADVAEPPSQPEVAAEAPRLGRFDARVVDADGTPWSGAELAAYLPRREDEPPSGRATTGLDGRVEVELEIPRWGVRPDGLRRDGAPALTFDLVVRRAGCATRRVEVVVRQDQTTHVGDIVLPEAAQVQGQVLDPEGRAVPDAVVGVMDASFLDELDRGRFERTGSRDLERLLAHGVEADGGFGLDDVPGTAVVLWAHAPDRRYALSEVLELAPRQRVEDLTLVLAPLRDVDRIAGQVVGPDGKGRRSSIVRDIRTGRARRTDSIQTDPEGRFDFPVDDPESVYDLAAFDGYGEFANAHEEGVRGGDLDVRIVFGGGRSIVVRLLDLEGAPIPGGSLLSDEGATVFQAKAEEVAPGELRLQCPDGTFRIEASAPGFRDARSAAYQPDTAPEVIELRLARAPRVVGVVTADGAPVAGAVVSAHGYDESGVMTVNGLRCTISPFPRGEARTDAGGAFELFVDSDEPVVVRASAEGWVDGESEPLDLSYADSKEGLEADLELTRGGAIEGRVLVPAGESPAGRVVGVHRGDGRPRSTRTAEDGTFRFEGLMPGDWYVLPLEAEVPPHGGAYASYSGSEPMPFNARVEAGATTRFELELD